MKHSEKLRPGRENPLRYQGSRHYYHVSRHQTRRRPDSLPSGRRAYPGWLWLGMTALGIGLMWLAGGFIF